VAVLCCVVIGHTGGAPGEVDLMHSGLAVMPAIAAIFGRGIY